MVQATCIAPKLFDFDETFSAQLKVLFLTAKYYTILRVLDPIAIDILEGHGSKARQDVRTNTWVPEVQSITDILPAKPGPLR